MNDAPAIRTPEVPGKRAAHGSGRGLRSSGEKSRLHRKKRKGRTVLTEELPCLTGRLDTRRSKQRRGVTAVQWFRGATDGSFGGKRLTDAS